MRPVDNKNLSKKIKPEDIKNRVLNFADLCAKCLKDRVEFHLPDESGKVDRKNPCATIQDVVTIIRDENRAFGGGDLQGGGLYSI